MKKKSSSKRRKSSELPDGKLDKVTGGAVRPAQVLPEVDDEVLVGFEPGDARQPLVIGSLWGSKKPPT